MIAFFEKVSKAMSSLKSTVTWVSVVGTRPQFIKISPLTRAIQAHNQASRAPVIEHRIINTGQHYDRELAELIFQQLRIPAPHCNLEVGSGSHGEQLARTLERIEPVFLRERPDWVIVYGDTNSALAGALVAARLGIAVAHVEAGCRSYNERMPEEQNRVLTDHLSRLLLAPSLSAVENLRHEGIGVARDRRRRRVTFVGDIMYDAYLANRPLAESLAHETLERFGLKANGYYLLTLHRAENTTQSNQVQNILQILEALELPVLFPVHPRTRDVLSQSRRPPSTSAVRMVPPLGYLDMLALAKHARKIVTDSGGVQKEALYLGVPCVTLREETEWPETVKIGGNQLVGTDEREILCAIREPAHSFESTIPPFGDGRTSALIVSELLMETQAGPEDKSLSMVGAAPTDVLTASGPKL